MAFPFTSSASRHQSITIGWIVCCLLLFASWTTADATPSPSKFENHLATANRGNGNGGLKHRYFAVRHGRSEANQAGIIASNPATAIENYGLTREGNGQAEAAGETLVQLFLKERRHCWRSRSSKKPPRGIAIVCSDFSRAYQTALHLVKAVGRHNRRVTSPVHKINLYFQTPSGDPHDPRGKGHTDKFFQQCDLTPFLTTDVRLRERWFGTWDGHSDVHYKDVWKDDVMDPHHTVEGVESVWSVVHRATQLVRDWEQLPLDSLVCHTQLGEAPPFALVSSSPHCGVLRETTNTKEEAAEDALSEDDYLWVVCVAHGDVLQILQTAFNPRMDPAQHRSLEHLETAGLRELVFQQ